MPPRRAGGRGGTGAARCSASAGEREGAAWGGSKGLSVTGIGFRVQGKGWGKQWQEREAGRWGWREKGQGEEGRWRWGLGFQSLGCIILQ